MSYSMSYLEDLQNYATAVEDEFTKVKNAFNTIDATDLPNGALDTQHFQVNPLVGEWSTSTSSTLQTVDEALGHVQTSWFPVETEWLRLGSVTLTTPWDPTGDYNLMHVSANANLARVLNVTGLSAARVLFAIGVQQGGVWYVLPRTVRPFSINDRRLDHVTNPRRSDIDMNTSTFLEDSGLPGSGTVTDVAIYASIAGGGGAGQANIDAYNFSFKTLRTGELTSV